MRLAVVQLHRRPHLLEGRFLENLFAVERRVPLRHIDSREIKRPVASGVEGWRNPFLILQFSINETVSGGAVRDDVSLADYASCFHVERLENAFLDKISVKFPGYFADQNAERQIAQIAVAPLFTGLESQRNQRRAL